MRGAIVGSSLVHLVLLVAVLAVRHGSSIVIAGPDVVQVALLDPVAPAAAPSGVGPGGAATRAVVYFRIGRGGDVTAVQLERGSGVDFFDRTAVRAVILSDPLPPLPLAYTGADLGVHFGFEIGG